MGKLSISMSIFNSDVLGRFQHFPIRDDFIWSPDDQEAKETARQARQHGPKTGFLPGHRERLKLVHALIVGLLWTFDD